MPGSESSNLNYHHLYAAVAGSAAAFRLTLKLEPVSPKVFPPTYEGGKYAVEERIIGGQKVPCVLLDSVPSQANRMELVVQDAWESGAVALPVVSVDFAKVENPGMRTITSLQAPHRIADAILRDSLHGEGTKAVKFRQSAIGQELDQLSTGYATPLLKYAPHCLVFGMWDSTGPRGGLGVKFARAIVSEVIGVNAVPGVKTSSRIDPLNIRVNAGVLYEAKAGGWTLDKELATKDAKKNPVKIGGDGKPSEANHGNVTPTISAGGFTMDYAEQTTVLSLPALRRLRFPAKPGAPTKPDADVAARTYLAALGLLGATLAVEAGYDLRSRCILRATDPVRWQLLGRPGEADQHFELTKEAALHLYKDALAAVEKADLPIHTKEIVLTPSDDLVTLVKKSMELAAAEGAGEDGVMFSIGVELLMRRAIITRWNNREEPEWPPHPDRVFMGLVAAFAESGNDPAERGGLEWLEGLGTPNLTVPAATSVRTSFTSFVPVNDTADPIQKGKTLAPMGSLPIGRGRQPRHFPAVVPDAPAFYLTWNVDIPANLRPALEAVCGKATYLGHSATPVRVWIDDKEVTANLVPVDGNATYRLRVFGKGRLQYLLDRFAAGLRPLPSFWQGYAPAQATAAAEPATPFDPGLIVLRQVGGRKFTLESCGMIAEALRDTLMQRYGHSDLEWLTGHQADGTPSRINRPAIFPLGFVGREHADGHLLGIAIAVPSDFDSSNVALLFDLFQRPEKRMDRRSHYDLPPDHPFVSLQFVNPVNHQPAGELALELDERSVSAREYTLRPETWTGPAQLWITATPLLLPQYPRRGLTPEKVVARACRDAGYPDAAAVRTSVAPALAGVPHPRSFFAGPRQPGRPPRPLIHAVVRFAEPIRGPVLLGAGRYNGFGVCRPISEEQTP